MVTTLFSLSRSNIWRYIIIRRENVAGKNKLHHQKSEQFSLYRCVDVFVRYSGPTVKYPYSHLNMNKWESDENCITQSNVIPLEKFKIKILMRCDLSSIELGVCVWGGG